MRGIHTSCPEPVSTINIVQNIVEMDGTRAFWDEVYTTGAAYSYLNYIALPYTPYARSQVTLMLNTAVMQQGPDFTVANNRIYLNFTPAAADLIHVRYFALTDGSSSILADSTIIAGMTVGYSGVSIPTGWLELDGVDANSHLISSYQTLWDNFLNTVAGAGYVKSSTATHFVLNKIDTPFYNGTTLVSGKTIIKT